MKKQKNKQNQGNGSCIKIFLWVFLFPVMLTIWIWKTKKIKHIGVKIGLIVMLWAVLIAYSEQDDSDLSSSQQEASVESVVTTEDSAEVDAVNTEVVTTDANTEIGNVADAVEVSDTLMSEAGDAAAESTQASAEAVNKIKYQQDYMSDESSASDEALDADQTTEDTDTESDVPSSSNYPVLTTNDISVYTLNDYAHIQDSGIILGENEGVTVTITVPEGTTNDEILVIGDETLLNVSYQDSNNSNQIKLYVTGRQTCNAELAIITAYELDTKGENAGGYVLNIRKLNSSEGRIAYVTPTGEKYHYSASCAGDNATKTTYYDCRAYDYEPCGKCAN